MDGKLPLPQLKQPDSTTTPPRVVPATRNLVTEWITMSAPCSRGRTR